MTANLLNYPSQWIGVDMSKLISVTGVSGRIAYSQPLDGRLIPHDRFITLPDSPWLRSRLAAGDIEEMRKVQEKPTTRRKTSKPDLPYDTVELDPATIETA